MAAAVELGTVNNPSKPALTVLKAAVTPAGSPEAVSVTTPVKPLRGVTEMAVVPFPPWTTCRLAGVSVIAKSAGAVTVMVMATEDVTLPEIPLTVTCVALAAAAPVAFRVRVLLVVALAGLNDAVTPAGKPVAVRATAPVKPALGAMVMVVVPEPPVATFTFVDDEDRLKPGAADTVRATVACAERDPAVAVMVNGAAPRVAVALAVIFSVTPVNVAVTPAGNAPIVRAGVPVKPFSAVIVKLVLPEAPCVTLKLEGDAAKVKLGPAFMVRLRVTEAVAVPEVPVIVTVDVPTGAVAAPVNVATAVVEVEAGLNETVTPVGRPEAVSVALPVKPVLGVMVMVLGAAAP